MFVGVANDGEVRGVEVTEQALNEILRQSKAERGEWFETDLLNVCDAQAVEIESGARWAHVIGVRSPDRPVFTLENGRYDMAGRSGSDSLGLDSRRSIERYLNWRRGEILRSCYRELKQYLPQISLHRPLPSGLPERLPFISRAAEDGSLYRFLTEEDLTFLFGAGVTNGGRSGGVVDLYYEVTGWTRERLSGKPIALHNVPLRDLGAGMMGFGNLDGDVRDRIAGFARYLDTKGFSVS